MRRISIGLARPFATALILIVDEGASSTFTLDVYPEPFTSEGHQVKRGARRNRARAPLGASRKRVRALLGARRKEDSTIREAENSVNVALPAAAAP